MRATSCGARDVRIRIINATTSWLRFAAMLEEIQTPKPFAERIEQFNRYMHCDCSSDMRKIRAGVVPESRPASMYRSVGYHQCLCRNRRRDEIQGVSKVRNYRRSEQTMERRSRLHGFSQIALNRLLMQRSIPIEKPASPLFKGSPG